MWQCIVSIHYEKKINQEATIKNSKKKKKFFKTYFNGQFWDTFDEGTAAFDLLPITKLL